MVVSIIACLTFAFSTYVLQMKSYIAYVAKWLLTKSRHISSFLEESGEQLHRRRKNDAYQWCDIKYCKTGIECC